MIALMLAYLAQAPAGFTPPAGFVMDAKSSKRFDFSHEPMEYHKGGTTERIDPEGQTWVIHMTLSPPNTTSDQTDAAMRAALKAQSWEIDTPSGTLVAHLANASKPQLWFKGSAFSGDYRATIVEVGPPPHALGLSAPAASPETIVDTGDFPYLAKFPGSTLKATTHPEKMLNASPPGGPEVLVGPPTVEKTYDLPAGVSPYEFMVVYRDALTRSGWTVVRTAAGSDAVIISHYAKNGRDIYGALHALGQGATFDVADVGAANESKALADALAKAGHVAIYGIYFDTDESTLRPDSDIALQHILDLLKGDPKLSVEIQGHTDNTGTAAHNKTLSDARASSVQKWLVDHGVAGARLTAKGYGDTQPAADNRTPEGRARNRRVELMKRS